MSPYAPALLSQPAASLALAETTVEFRRLARRIQPPEGLIRRNWRRHPNGKGWVERSAVVDRTAFVGPGAIVMEGARVLNDARIEDRAVVAGAAVVADLSVVRDNASVDGGALVLGRSIVSGAAELRGYAVLVNEVVRRGTLAPSTSADRIKWMRAAEQIRRP